MKPVGVGRAGRKPQVPRSSAKRQLGSGHGALAGIHARPWQELHQSHRRGQTRGWSRIKRELGDRKWLASVGNPLLQRCPQPPSQPRGDASSLQ